MSGIDSVTIYQIRLPRHHPCVITPTVLAESYGSNVAADKAVEQIFGCIPFPWNIYIDVADTPTGLAKRLARMHDPERLYSARRESIKKRLAQSDPMFYDQMIGPMLTNDFYDLGYYRRRQRQIADMHRKIAVPEDKVGKLWISPEAERLKKFDWPGMALELRDLVIEKVDVYEAQEMVLEKHGVK